MTETQKDAIAERMAATVNMMMGESGQGHWTLEDYNHVITIAWYDTGGVYACDVSVDDGSEVVSHVGDVSHDESAIGELVRVALT